MGAENSFGGRTSAACPFTPMFTNISISTLVRNFYYPLELSLNDCFETILLQKTKLKCKDNFNGREKKLFYGQSDRCRQFKLNRFSPHSVLIVTQ